MMLKKKKKNYSRYFQQVNRTNNILAQQSYTMGIKRIPPFSHTMLVDRRRSYIFAILTFPEEKRSSFKNYKSQSFLTDQPLSKHFRVKLDLDGLRKARYPRITKRETKRVSVLSLCRDQRQETLLNLGFFSKNY